MPKNLSSLMKLNILILISSVYFLLVGCGHNKSKIWLKQIGEARYIIYERKAAKFYFPNNEFIKYCKNQDSTIHNNFVFKDALRYIERYGDAQIIISDTLGMKLEYNHFAKRDSLIYIRDQENINAYVTDAVNDALILFAKAGNLKVYDKKNKHFVNFIIIDIVNTEKYGATSILLPDNSVAYSQLNYIQ
jgi:hypothetical protein